MLCSVVLSIPEVVGSAAFLVNPESVEELAAPMEKISGDEHLRREMKRRGLERAKQFSWASIARETITSYEKLLGRKR